MPTISMFYGIIIRMYFAPEEHNPPHIHAFYQEDEATFSIESGDKIKGKFHNKKARLVSAWIEIHREELMADWKLCQNGENPIKIEGLR